MFFLWVGETHIDMQSANYQNHVQQCGGEIQRKWPRLCQIIKDFPKPAKTPIPSKLSQNEQTSVGGFAR